MSERALAGVEAEVWVLPTEGLGPLQEARAAALLDAAETARAARFHFDRDRRDYRFAHALLRLLLSSAAPRDPRAWRFRDGAGGKPELAQPEPEPLHFNLSHTRGCVACLAGRLPQIGVDLESRDRRVSPDLGERLFAPAEAALLRHPDEALRWERFFRIWTLKEAYLKATGQGLRTPLNAFAFSLEPPAVRFAPALADDPATWHFEQRLLPGDFVAAVAQRSPAGRPALRWRLLSDLPAVW